MLKKLAAALSTMLVFTHPAIATELLSPVAVVSSPPTLITGFTFDRTIDQSGLTQGFVSGSTSLADYVASDPIHVGTNMPQTYAETPQLPDPVLAVVYDLGDNYSVSSLVFWNYPISGSSAVTRFSTITSEQENFVNGRNVGTFFPVSDGGILTGESHAQVFNLVVSNARFVRISITEAETASGTGFSEIAFGVSEPIFDTDGDGVPDDEDNCTVAVNTSQLDTDQDGYGNYCDPDFNNDNVVNFQDIALWIPSFININFDPDHDLDGSGSVNHIDYILLTYLYLGQPGPSGLVPSMQSDPDFAVRNSRNK